jgi:hypothetical protein
VPKCSICRRKIRLKDEYLHEVRGGQNRWYCARCYESLEGIENTLEGIGFELDKLIREFGGLKQVVEDLLKRASKKSST